jgi:hypothetical protein
MSMKLKDLLKSGLEALVMVYDPNHAAHWF